MTFNITQIRIKTIGRNTGVGRQTWIAKTFLQCKRNRFLNDDTVNQLFEAIFGKG
jgi:hypothetical protein